MRIGAAAMTTRGLKEDDFVRVVGLVDKVLTNHDNDAIITSVRGEINEWMQNYPLFQ